MNLWRAAAELARAGSGGALATVARTAGSTPVPTGTKMLIGPTERLSGTVGGGCVEADVLGAGIEAQRLGAPIIRTHHLNADLAGDLGLSCGGTVDIFVEPLAAAEGYVAALEAAAAAEQGIVTTAVSWATGPAKRFDPCEPPPGAPAAALSPDGRLVVEHLTRSPRVIVFGAGHVGAAIARAAAAAGFRVSVMDDRAEFAAASRFPPEVSVRAVPVAEAFAGLDLGARDAVVIATRGHREDAVILERVAASAAGYVGLLGSRRKRAVLTRALTAAGIPPEALARVRVPVGLDIGAETPAEIAVSVVAELIAWRRGGSGRLG